MKNNLLIYSIIFAFIFVISKIILNSFNLDFMYSIYQILFFIIYITAIIGFIQIAKENKILLVLAILITIIISYFVIIGAILSSRTVKIITIDNQKIVTETFGIPDPMTFYYKYINSFLKSYDTIKPPEKEQKTNNSEFDTIMRFYNKTINTTIEHYD